MDECRKQFEEFASGNEKIPLDKWEGPGKNGGYKDPRTYAAFFGWKAAWNRRSCDRDAVIEECARIADETFFTDDRLPAAIRALKSQPADDRIAQMERDAARYRWLKNTSPVQPNGMHPIGYCSPPNQTIDEAIDAAMRGRGFRLHCGQDAKGGE